MSNLGRPVKRGDRKVLNTTIDRKTMNAFRERCQEIGTPMNVVLEAFMMQFAEGQFMIKIGKSKLEVDLEE